VDAPDLGHAALDLDLAVAADAVRGLLVGAA